MKKILILGVNGYTGKAFQEYIEKKRLFEKFHFTGIDKIISNKISDKVTFIVDDLTNTNWSFLDIHPDYIINLIARTDIIDFSELLKYNLLISNDLLTNVLNKKIDVKKILLIGSAAEYGSNTNLPLSENSELMPVNLYGLLKVYQTALAKYYFNNYSLPISIARTFNIIGGDMPLSLSVGSFKDQIKKAKDGDDILTGNLNTKRDFLHIFDVLDAYLIILVKGKPGEIYNVCSGTSLSMLTLLTNMIERSGKKLNIKIKEERFKKNDIRDSYGNIMKITELGWQMKHNILEL